MLSCAQHPVRATASRVLAAILAVAVVIAAAEATTAAVYNLHLYTDSGPDYTTLEAYAGSATTAWTDPQDQAIAVWRWAVRHRRQTHATREDGRGLFDPVMFFNSYANTYCGFLAGILQPLYESLGPSWRTRYIELPDHTVMEVSWDAGATWHMFDASMNIYCLDASGVVASAAQLAAPGSSDLSQWLGESGPVPGHDYLYRFAPECGTNPVNPAHPELSYPWGYRGASDNPVPNARTLRNGADSFIGGAQVQDTFTHARSGWRYRLNLRRWEHYTRYYDHLGETADHARPTSSGIDPDDITPAGDMRANGRWVFAPDLATPGYRLAIHDESGLAHISEQGTPGPRVRPSVAGQAGALLLKVYGANVVTSGMVRLTGVRGAAADRVAVSVSRDAGIDWDEVWSAPSVGSFDQQVALPAALVGGAFEYLVRIELLAATTPEACGLDAVTIETITQLSRPALPRLQRGRNLARLWLGEQEESCELWPPLHDDGGGPQFLRTAADHADVWASTSADHFDSAILRPATGGVPAHVTWRLAVPTEITGLRYGGSLIARGGGADAVSLAHSFDGAGFVTDAVHTGVGTSTWDARVYAAVDAVPAGARQAWLRYAFASPHAADVTSPGLQDALIYIQHEPRDPQRQPIEVTFCWTEHRATGDVDRQHTQVLAGADETWAIDVAGLRDPTMNWLRVNLAGYGPDGSGVQPGYSDGEDVGPAAGYDKRRVRFLWQDNAAYQRPYTVSRPASASNPDAGGELTNGCLIPSTSYSTAGVVQEQTALWSAGAPVDVVIDLGGPRTVAAVRITTHQPATSWCHPAAVDVSVSTDGANYSYLGSVDHDDLWSPAGDWLGWEREASPTFAALPAGGRLAYSFWLLPAATPQARHVSCRLIPLAGAGLGISEIQVFTDVELEDWPDREIVMPGMTGIEPWGSDGDDGTGRGLDLDHGQAVPSPDDPLLTTAPNPFNASVMIGYAMPSAGPVRLVVHDVAGRRVRLLLDGVDRPAGRHALAWDGRDDAGRSLPSGVYICRLTTAGVERTARLVLVK